MHCAPLMYLLAFEFVVLALAPSLVTGAGAALATYWVLAALRSDRLAQGDEWRYDISRINELRRVDGLYRIFQPLIQWLARLNRQAFAGQLREVYREILAAGLPRVWLPEEYLARMQVISLLLLPGCMAFAFSQWGWNGVLPALVAIGLTFYLLRRRLTQQARRRLLLIKRRLPFLLDLLTLLMESGASFLQALKQAVSEFDRHPVAVEFGRVLADMSMGKARSEAFDSLRQRLNDEEIDSIVGAILQSEELGTPLADILRTQADVLRVKRSQRAETIAGEAGVNMLLPGVLVMAATVIIILGPFLLNYFLFERG